MPENLHLNIVIAGASGFIGQAIIPKLRIKFPRARITALSRSAIQSTDELTEWKACDLFSLKALEDALPSRVDLAIYLVHSMGPTAGMDQGSFADFDLLLADNFVRSLKNKAVQQIIYLGGLVPDCKQLSLHLQSRLEVEETFVASTLPTTIFRAGLIVGEGGSSFQIMQKLVNRLPLMLCPKWTQTLTTPVDLAFAVFSIVDASLNTKAIDSVYDLASCEPLTYLQMMRDTATAMQKRRFFFTLPFFTPFLSRLWVSLITGSSKALVYPLVASLEHEMVARKTKLYLPVENGSTYLSLLRKIHINTVKNTSISKFQAVRKTVRSVQRMPLPPGRDAAWVCKEYERWLPDFLNPMVGVTTSESEVLFKLRFVSAVMLDLEVSQERSTPDRQLLYVRGGLLAAKNNKGRLEFRSVLNKKVVISALHDFSPSLPWWIYRRSQAVIHSWVMHSFGKHLKTMAHQDI